ncbi:MAG TPA: hypothetical protein VLA19_15985 [Herpetosiphonaceae bacterium]|nr:hypothetical protein [Herpetosiphonaceae bacterium]
MGRLSTPGLDVLPAGVVVGGHQSSTQAVSDIPHDRRRTDEVRTCLAEGNIKGARRAAEQIRGNRDRELMEAEIDAAVALGRGEHGQE